MLTQHPITPPWSQGCHMHGCHNLVAATLYGVDFNSRNQGNNYYNTMNTMNQKACPACLDDMGTLDTWLVALVAISVHLIIANIILIVHWFLLHQHWTILTCNRKTCAFLVRSSIAPYIHIIMRIPKMLIPNWIIHVYCIRSTMASFLLGKFPW